MNSGPWGNRRLTAADSCLSCFVKAASLPFVAADSGDKRERKWRISCDGNRIRSVGGGGGGRRGSSCLHIPTIPGEAWSVFVCRLDSGLGLGLDYYTLTWCLGRR